MVHRRWRNVGVVAALSAVQGLVLGYVFFQIVFPSLAVPSGDRLPLTIVPWMFVALGVLVGFVADRLEDVAISTFAAIFIGLVMAYGLFVAPTAAEEIVGVELSGFAFAITRMVLPVVFLAFITLFGGGLLGWALYQRLEARAVGPDVFAEWDETQRGGAE
jgi:hypothetical protein